MKFISFIEDNFVIYKPIELNTYKPRTFIQWFRNDKQEIVHTEYLGGRSIYSDIVIESKLELITIGQKIPKLELDEYIFYGVIPIIFENNRFRCCVDYTEKCVVI